MDLLVIRYGQIYRLFRKQARPLTPLEGMRHQLPPPRPNRKIAMRSLLVFRGNYTKLKDCLPLPLPAFLSTTMATIKIYCIRTKTFNLRCSPSPSPLLEIILT
jgi:hypothetical protein